MPKNAENFYCETCDFKCSKQSNFLTHLNTRKHKRIQNDTIIMPQLCQPIQPVVEDHSCICGKKYKYRTGLYSHAKKCQFVEVPKEKKEKMVMPDEPTVDFLQNMIKNLLEQNKQYVKIIENSNTQHVNNSINGNVTVNQTRYNLNFFLNEECKEACNITDYVDTVNLTVTDLEETMKLGYTDGISKIINDRIKEMGVRRRPYHCTDSKREIVYVKDKDIWEREDSDKPKMKQMITSIINKNLQQLSQWKAANPECSDLSNKKGEEYLNMMIEANGGQEREKKEERILKNIVREVIL